MRFELMRMRHSAQPQRLQVDERQVTCHVVSQALAPKRRHDVLQLPSAKCIEHHMQHTMFQVGGTETAPAAACAAARGRWLEQQRWLQQQPLLQQQPWLQQ